MRKAPKRGRGFRFVLRVRLAPPVNWPLGSGTRLIVSCQVLFGTVVLTQMRRNGGALWVLTSRAGGLRKLNYHFLLADTIFLTGPITQHAHRTYRPLSDEAGAPIPPHTHQSSSGNITVITGFRSSPGPHTALSVTSFGPSWSFCTRSLNRSSSPPALLKRIPCPNIHSA